MLGKNILFKSAIAILLSVYLVSAIRIVCLRYESIKNDVILDRLNNAVPLSYETFKRISSRPRGLRKKAISEVDTYYLEFYSKYYSLINHYFPQNMYAYGMRAYCFSLLGDDDKALEFYNKALILNESFIYYYINIGKILFLKKDYAEAQKYFMKAISMEFEETKIHILNSKRVYLPIVSYQSNNSVLYNYELSGDYNTYITEDFKKEIDEVYVLLGYIFWKLDDKYNLFNHSLFSLNRKTDYDYIYYYYIASLYAESNSLKSINFLHKSLKEKSDFLEVYDLLREILTEKQNLVDVKKLNIKIDTMVKEKKYFSIEDWVSDVSLSQY